MTPKGHQLARESVATTVCVHTGIDVWEDSTIVLTWSLMSLLKLLLLGYW